MFTGCSPSEDLHKNLESYSGIVLWSDSWLQCFSVCVGVGAVARLILSPSSWRTVLPNFVDLSRRRIQFLHQCGARFLGLLLVTLLGVGSGDATLALFALVE